MIHWFQRATNETHVDVFHPINYAPFFDPFNEGITGPIVRNGQAQGILTFGDLNLLIAPWKNKTENVTSIY